MPTIIHWFRRDLRLHDNLALIEALRASGGRVVPLFVFDNTILRSRRVGPARVQFMLESLHALNHALRERGSQLVVRRGPPERELIGVARESGAEGVFFNRDYTPFARERDQRVEAALREQRLDIQTFQDLVIVEPDDLLTKAGKPYTVYTPYRRQWRTRIESDPRAVIGEQQLAAFAPLPDQLTLGTLPTLQDLGFTPRQNARPGGEAEGLKRLHAFVDLSNSDGISDYHNQRDLMARPATSRLSAYLHLGCVSTQACLRAALYALEEAQGEARNGVDGWMNELAWHDFYMQILYHFPYVLRGAFKQEYNRLEWSNNEEHFAAWCEGRTGYPIVDAAMRQLNTEAWMHNRARMIVASFLIKDLLINWRWGEDYFLQQLVDGDHAANNGGWQWVAGTGTDAQPYFRIFNPVSQGQKFDPQGEYVRRYVPELALVPNKYIHQPWTMPESEQRKAGVTIGSEYPQPIIDHRIQREKALEMYSRVTTRPQLASKAAQHED